MMKPIFVIFLSTKLAASGGNVEMRKVKFKNHDKIVKKIAKLVFIVKFQLNSCEGLLRWHKKSDIVYRWNLKHFPFP